MAVPVAESTPDDEQLAAVVARRQESAPAPADARAAFEQLYRRHARPLLAFLAARARRSDLDDLHQEVWRRAWEHLPGGFRGGSFRAWLYQIARNALIDHGRKRRSEPLANAEARPDPGENSPERALIERERSEALRRCLEWLGIEAAALVRGRLGGESYVDLCPRLGMKPERAHKLFHLAKSELQHCVERALS